MTWIGVRTPGWLVAQDPRQLVVRDVASAHDQADVLTDECIAMFDRCRERRGTRALDDQAGRFDQQANRGSDLVVADQHDLIDHARKQSQGHVKRLAGRQPFGKRVDVFGDDPAPSRHE